MNSAAVIDAATFREGRRQLDICNACRYCEGYCAVFPALERRVELSGGDLVQLANLCHDCRDCLYACMYAPPHEFGVNPPLIFAEIRRQQADHASQLTTTVFRRPLPRRNVTVAALGVAAVAVVIAAIASVGSAGLGQAGHGPSSPYRVVSYAALLVLGGGTAAFGFGLLLTATRRTWRSAGPPLRPSISAICRAIAAAAVLRRLDGGGAGCSYPDEDVSPSRRIAHILVAWGFMACLLATVAAGVEQDFLSRQPPYPLISFPVLAGLVGGVAMVLGATGLIEMKRRSDPAASDARSIRRDDGLLVGLLALGLSGLACLACRTTAAYGALLVVHLAIVLACFVLAPFSKFSHGLFRLAALVRDEAELEQERAARASG